MHLGLVERPTRAEPQQIDVMYARARSASAGPIHAAPPAVYASRLGRCHLLYTSRTCVCAGMIEGGYGDASFGADPRCYTQAWSMSWMLRNCRLDRKWTSRRSHVRPAGRRVQVSFFLFFFVCLFDRTTRRPTRAEARQIDAIYYTPVVRVCVQA